MLSVSGDPRDVTTESSSSPSDGTRPTGRNGLATGALWTAIGGFVVPILASATIQTANPDARSPLPAFGLPMVICGVIAIVLGASGLRRARECGRGRGVAWAAICVGIVAVLAGLGQVARLADRDRSDSSVEVLVHRPVAGAAVGGPAEG